MILNDQRLGMCKRCEEYQAAADAADDGIGSLKKTSFTSEPTRACSKEGENATFNPGLPSMTKKRVEVGTLRFSAEYETEESTRYSSLPHTVRQFVLLTAACA